MGKSDPCRSACVLDRPCQEIRCIDSQGEWAGPCPKAHTDAVGLWGLGGLLQLLHPLYELLQIPKVDIALAVLLHLECR